MGLVTTLPGQASGPPAEFACARCWKHKKKCDKVTPTCGRCSTRTATCVYSFLPPKESVFAFRALYPETGSSSYARGSETCPAPLMNTNLGSSLPPQFSQDGSNDLASQAAAILNCHSVDIEGICKRYFLIFHGWLSFIPQKEFWLHFYSSKPSTDPEFSALLLSIYLIIYPVAGNKPQEEFIEFVYFVAKSSWIQLQTTSKPSILLIQTGLLLATYENGQALQGASRSSMGACVAMGHAMNLHSSIKQNVILDPDAQVSLPVQRCLWWGVVILERLLSARSLESLESGTCHFISQCPTLDDCLPLDTTYYNTSDMRVATKTGPKLSEIVFADVPPYSALAQAICLFDCVFKYIKNRTSEAQSQEAAASLDRILREFTSSMMRQAAGQPLEGNYCSAFFTSIICLTVLHRYEISRRNFSDECRADSLSEHWLAISTMARIFRETTNQHLQGPRPAVPNVLSYDIYVIYISLTMHVSVGDRSDEEKWQEELQLSLEYLRQLQQKWKIAGVYLRIIERMLG